MKDCSMKIAIQFNRPLNEEKDWVMPGGYEINTGGKSVRFDFLLSYGNIDACNRKTCYFELLEPDFDSFPDFKKVTVEDLKRVSEIAECYVYTGEDESLYETRIMEIVFMVSDENIVLNSNVIERYNRKIKERNEFYAEKTVDILFERMISRLVLRLFKRKTVRKKVK